MTETALLLRDVILILGIAAGVRFVAERVRLPYTVALVVVGFFVSVSSVTVQLNLSSDLIFKILLPTIIFQGAEETKSEHFRDTVPEAIAMAVLGLPLATLLLGFAGSYAFGLPLVVTLLFAVIIYPIDPVSVIALFQETDAPEQLGVLAETESHLSEGFAIVTYAVLLGFVQRQFRSAQTLEGLVTPESMFDVALEITWVSLGGVVVGLAIGGVVYLVLRHVTERMAQLLLMVVLPYASYLVAEEVFHLSGVLAVTAAGLLMGTYGKERVLRPESVEFMEEIWRTGAFLASTVLFLLIGVVVPMNALLDNIELILVASILVLLTRAAVVYFIIDVTNRTAPPPIPMNYQHVLVWGGMHTVVPVALVLSLPSELPFRRTVAVMVFGVAVLSIAVQGFLMPYVLRTIGTTKSLDETVDT